MSKNLNESQSMGEMHTKGMIFVFNELKNAKGAGFLVLSDKKSDKSPLYMAKQYVLSFIKKEYDESELMFNAISVGKASCSYWHDHLIEWIELLSESRERGWFSWKSVIGNDIGGAIGGAIAGAIFGGGAGAGPASISGAIVGSVSSAVAQVIEH